MCGTNIFCFCQNRAITTGAFYFAHDPQIEWLNLEQKRLKSNSVLYLAEEQYSVETKFLFQIIVILINADNKACKNLKTF